tara:strand:- start:1584 stop:1745 length:162 start_codon:yes stop_codon:yes gene_type:complete
VQGLGVVAPDLGFWWVDRTLKHDLCGRAGIVFAVCGDNDQGAIDILKDYVWLG